MREVIEIVKEREAVQEEIKIKEEEFENWKKWQLKKIQDLNEEVRKALNDRYEEERMAKKTEEERLYKGYATEWGWKLRQWNITIREGYIRVWDDKRNYSGVTNLYCGIIWNDGMPKKYVVKYIMKVLSDN